MATRNHGNRLLIAIEQSDFFNFHIKNVYVFKQFSTKILLLEIKKPNSANVSSK